MLYRIRALMNTNLWRSAELLVIFIGIPLGFYFHLIDTYKIPVLLTVFLYSLFICGTCSKHETLKDKRSVTKHLPALFYRFAGVAMILILILVLYDKSMFFDFLKTRPLIWLVVMCLYPFLSAFPQEFIFRVFFFQRYSDWFQSKWSLIAVNSVLFSFTHIVYNNWIAVGFTLIAGIVFSMVYLKTNSFKLVWLEHMLYGQFLFTIGWGRFFYNPPG